MNTDARPYFVQEDATQDTARMRLINKIKLVFAIELLLIIATMVLAGRFTIDTGTSALRETIEDNLFQHSRDTMMRVEVGLNERIDSFREYTSDLILQETLERSNADFDRMEDASAYIDRIEAEWTGTPEDKTTAVMNTIMGNKLSREISEKVAYNENKFGQSVYGEVFVTNRYGALAASSNRKTDFRQNDEEWWQVARNEGESLIGPYFDESLGKEALAAGIRIDNEDGEFVGVLKAVVDIAFIKSLMNNEFLVYYQPEVETGTGRIKAFEALVRWQEPAGGGLIPPCEFIPIAEHTGLIIPLGEWVLKNAATQARAWREMGYTDLRVAVNLSFRQFKKKGFIDTIKRIIKETGADPDSLELELTESILMDDVESVISILVELKAMGVRLAIDDFGTGFSSLAYIKRMPIDKLKIDGSFIRNITTDKDDLAIAVSIIRMSHAMGLEVLAEQMETEAQRDLLSTLMCDFCQGFLFSRPTNAKEATDLLVGNRQTKIFAKPVVRA